MGSIEGLWEYKYGRAGTWPDLSDFGPGRSEPVMPCKNRRRLKRSVMSVWVRIRTATSVAIVLLLGIVLTVAVFWQERDSSLKALEDSFRTAAADRKDRIRDVLQSDLFALQALHGYYNASPSIDRQGFQRFVSPLLRNGGVQAFEWVPRVPREHREKYEDAARPAGLKGFEIKEKITGGKLIRAGDRPEYFPVYFVEPMRGNEAALGFDLASNQERLSALEKARDTGKPAATERITLVQETGNEFGFLVFFPVYERGAPIATMRDRRKHLNGFMLGVFRLGDLVTSAISKTQPLGLPTRLLDLV